VSERLTGLAVEEDGGGQASVHLRHQGLHSCPADLRGRGGGGTIARTHYA
jgi:hypothetical protein